MELPSQEYQWSFKEGRHKKWELKLLVIKGIHHADAQCKGKMIFSLENLCKVSINLQQMRASSSKAPINLCQWQKKTEHLFFPLPEISSSTRSRGGIANVARQRQPGDDVYFVFLSFSFLMIVSLLLLFRFAPFDRFHLTRLLPVRRLQTSVLSFSLWLWFTSLLKPYLWNPIHN